MSVYYKIVPSLKNKCIVEQNNKLYYVKRKEKYMGFDNFQAALKATQKKVFRYDYRKKKGGQGKRYGKVLLLQPVEIDEVLEINSNPLIEKVFSQIQIFEITRVLNFEEIKDWSMLA